MNLKIFHFPLQSQSLEDAWQSLLMEFICGLVIAAWRLSALAGRIAFRGLAEQENMRARVSSRLRAFGVMCDSGTGELQPAVAPAVRRESTICGRHSLARRYLAGIAAFACLAMLSARTGRAQAVYGSIVGSVTDTTDAIIPNAKVTVTDTSKGTSQVVMSNGTGEFRVDNLIPDTYSVSATYPGFTPAEVKGIQVAADTSPEVDLHLAVASAQQTVVVTSVAPPLKSDRADVAEVLDEQQLQDLPNQDRNSTSFTLLIPGVQRDSYNTAPTENPQGTLAIQADGSNYGTMGWELDGTDNREPIDGIIVINPTLDSLSEMKVTTQNYPAEFGGSVGGVVTAETRSGGNELHGDVFEYRRSDALEARDPFTQFQPDPVTGKFIPSSVYNQFGGSIDGPIIRKKAFYFLDYQGSRQKVGTSLQENVPTNEVRNTCLTGTGVCDLSQYTTAPLFDPNNGQTYTGGQIPASAISPQAQTLLGQLPGSNAGTGIVNNFIGAGTGNNDGDQADVRFDYQVVQDVHAFGRYDYANFRLNGAPVFGAAGGPGFGLGNTTGNDNVQNQSVATGFDWAINTNLLTDLRFGFLDYHVSDNKFDAGADPATAAGIPNLNTSQPDTSGSPSYDFADNSISNFGNQNCNCPLLESEQVFQIANNWTRIVGNHSIRFGADLRYAMNLRNASDNNRTGLLTFSNSTSAVASASGSGLGLASILFGDVAQFQRFDVYDQTASNRQKRAGFYGEDSWRVTPRFTLNYGVRWDVILPETVNRPGNGGFTYLPTGIIRVAGVGGIGTNGDAELDPTDFGGRLGFAYLLRPKTVIRGAAGQVYDDVGFYGTIFGSAMTQNLPVLNNEDTGSTSAVDTAVYTFSTMPVEPGPPYVPANGIIPLSSINSPNIRPNRLILPRVDQFNLSVEQEITQNMTATLAYVGNIAERIYPGETEGFNINVPQLPASPAQLANRNARRPYYGRFSTPYDGTVVTCCTQDLNYEGPSARATYNSLQASVQKRLSNGLQFTANYVWSKAINYGTTYFAQEPSVEYGANDTNRGQDFVLNGIFELPFGQHKQFADTSNRWMNYAVGGWELAGTTTWESGLPFTPTYAECGSDQDIDTNFASPGTSSDCRPDTTGGVLPMHVGGFDPVAHARSYFTPVAPLTAAGVTSGPFIRPAFGTIGDVGRNSYRGPRDYFADVSLFKNFAITERVKGQFQLQFFNLFNHVPLGAPDASESRCIDCSQSTTGKITSVDTSVESAGLPYMRQLEFGSRIFF
jgi:Carboxypeptidase regulatory-like domain